MFKHSRSLRGVAVSDETYSIKLAFDKRREQFNTGEKEKSAASVVAAEIYRSLDRLGWDATLKEYKPGKLDRTDAANGIILEPTVGDFIAAVGRLSEVRPYTLGCYSRSFRHIVADVVKIKGDESRFDYVNGGAGRWRELVDAVKLVALTPLKIQAWKMAFVARGESNQQSERTSKVSVNSIMRQAKSLFSDKRGVLSLVRDLMRLPSPLPFDGVGFYENQSMRYQSKIDAGELLTGARDELAMSDPEAFKMMVLALCCGLRRNEIDKLAWRQVDLAKGVIRIETTRWFRAKSEDSLGEVDLDPELVVLMRGWKAKAVGEFVVQGEVQPRLGKGYSHYRAFRVAERLAEWLRGKGLEDRKALHTLRKEFGSLVAEEHGIYAASRALRHADIQVTAKHYLDKKQRISIGLGRLLAPANVVAADFKNGAKQALPVTASRTAKVIA
jgi:integrase